MLSNMLFSVRFLCNAGPELWWLMNWRCQNSQQHLISDEVNHKCMLWNKLMCKSYMAKRVYVFFCKRERLIGQGYFTLRFLTQIIILFHIYYLSDRNSWGILTFLYIVDSFLPRSLDIQIYEILTMLYGANNGIGERFMCFPWAL